MIKHVQEPVFRRVKYDLSKMTIFERFMFVSKNPPRLVLEKDFIITLKNDLQIIIPSNFITDGASVPRAIWAVPGFSPYGILLEGGIPHDFAYQYGYLLSITKNGFNYSEQSLKMKQIYGDKFPENTTPIFVGKDQKFFDNFLREVCQFSTDSKIISNSAYLALRYFGYHAWNKYRNNGPGAYNFNSLKYPGLNHNGYIF